MSDTATVEKTKNFGATEAGKTFYVPLELIGTYNVREVLPRLSAAGYSYTDLLKMAIGTKESKAEFVRLIEEHEAETRRLAPKEQTLIDLAHSIFDNRLIQPIMVRQTGTRERRDVVTGEKMGEKSYGYQIIVGGRRTMAVAYLHAQGLYDAEIEAKLRTANKEECRDISIAENLHRRNFDPVQVGEIVASFREDDTPLSWDEIAKRLRFCKKTLQDCYVLARPDIDAPTDLMEQVSTGVITKATAVSIAKGKRGLGDGGNRLLAGPVRKAISVKAIEAKIDATPDDNDPVNVARLTALAECLGSTYDAEMALSKARLAKRAAKEAVKPEETVSF